MKISVVGLGYVGSVAAAGLAAAGHDVLGIDVDRQRVESYQRGDVPFYEPGLPELVKSSQECGSLRVLHVAEVVEQLGEIIIICVGTPSSQTGSVDLSYVRSALKRVMEIQPEGGVIVMKSTVPPGTGVRMLQADLSGTEFEYVSNPEFLREGQAVYDWFNPDRIVVGGENEGAVELVRAMYENIEAPHIVCDITSAEMVKYAANAFLATKISFINEIANLCDRLGATIDKVKQGISLDPRIGPYFLNAGVGYGGSCFPKDTRALDDLALANGHNFELLRSVIAVNNRQRLLPLFALRERFSNLAGVRVGVFGLSFKPDTDDVRESPSIELIRVLIEEGAVVSAYDPWANHNASRVLPESVGFSHDPVSCADGTQAIVLMTEWPEIISADWEQIAGFVNMPRFVFDGRNALDQERMQELGFEYRGVGRGAARPAIDAVAAGD